jgi:gamma-glutamyltranspeptidase/glutathione hydrolase
MINFGMDVQEALDRPRFKVVLTNTDHAVGNIVQLEKGISQDIAEGLITKGYKVEHDSNFFNFGRGQIIQKKISRSKNGGEMHVYWAGSDPRADGMAIGF